MAGRPRAGESEVSDRRAKFRKGGHSVLYLKLFHGRTNIEDNLDDWGFDGPILGPLKYVHGTHRHHLAIEYDTSEGPAVDGWLEYVEDCIYYDGAYFGDFSAYESSTWEPKTTTWNPLLAEPPALPKTCCREGCSCA